MWDQCWGKGFALVSTEEKLWISTKLIKIQFEKEDLLIQRNDNSSTEVTIIQVVRKPHKGVFAGKYPSSKSQETLDIWKPKEEKIAIQKESPSKEKSEYQYPLKDNIPLPKQTYIPTSQFNGSCYSFKNQIWLWNWLPSLNLSMLLKEKFRVSVSYRELPGVTQKEDKSRD